MEIKIKPFSLATYCHIRIIAYESVMAGRVELIPRYAMHDHFIEQIGQSLCCFYLTVGIPPTGYQS